jgi:hypothetical protein
LKREIYKQHPELPVADDSTETMEKLTAAQDIWGWLGDELLATFVVN